MKLALIQCPAFGIDRPPLALASLCAFTRRQGFIVQVFDLNIEAYVLTKKKDRKLWEFQFVFEWINGGVFLKENILPETFFKAWAEKIVETDSEIIGFSVQSTSLFASIQLAKEIKRLVSDKIIIFGGPLNSSYSIEHAYYLLQIKDDSGINIVDIVVLGEGEETLVEVLQRVENNDSLEGCLGTVHRINGRIVNNGLRPLIPNLDIIPFPEFKDFTDLYEYGKRRVPILGSRGCIHRCVFCDDTLIWRKYRFRSVENIIEEMKLRKKEGVEFLEFNDLLINGDLNHLYRLCDSIIKGKLDIHWGASASINGRMNLDFFKKLKQAGCCYLNYGIESASPKVLREMNKGFSINDVKWAIQNTYKAGISVATNWVVGFPTETQEDFIETLNFIKENFEYLKGNLMINSFILKDNSIIFEQRDKFGIVSDNQRNWYSQGGLNTEEERKRRYDKFKALIIQLGDVLAHETFQK